jgi:penicillin-binding protein 1A
MVRELPSYESEKRRPKRHVVVLLGVFWALFASSLVLSHTLFSELPDTANLLSYEPGKDVTLLDIKGRAIARRGLTQGALVNVDALPAYVGNAFIAVEDRRFRSHFGIDLLALARAISIDWRAGALVQGGSTLTQQLAKNLFLKPDRTFKRKIDEAVLAITLERRYSKDEILSLYLNHVYFGGGVYGIEAAAERFFGKAAAQLSLTEAAMLAGSVKAPSRFNPAADPDAAMARASLVLDLMQANGFIDERTRLAAISTRPTLARLTATPGAGYFVDYAYSLVPQFAGRAKERLIVETTFDLDLQTVAERAVEDGLAKDGAKLAAGQGALVAMTQDGQVRALVGGRSYDESGFDRATDAMRQPGSAFKPFVYLAALEHGHRPTDEVFDGPVTIGKWQPDNYEGAYEGSITLTHAFAHSSNSAAVQLTREVGPEAVARVARRLGLGSELNAVPSLALGTSEVTPLELTGGYAAFANGGTGVIPYVIVRVRTETGKVIYRRQGSGLARVMSQTDNANMTAMMLETVKTGTGKQAALLDRPIAGKTGTSQDYRDAWFVGFSADYVCGVWIGNDSGAPMNKATGGGLPARIFKSFMSKAERDLPPRPLLGTPYLVANNAAAAASPSISGPDISEDKTVRKSDADLLDEFQNILDGLF